MYLEGVILGYLLYARYKAWMIHRGELKPIFLQCNVGPYSNINKRRDE